MKKTKNGTEHDITQLFARTQYGRGLNAKYFINQLQLDIANCKSKGMKGPITIQHVNGGIYGQKVLLLGK